MSTSHVHAYNPSMSQCIVPCSHRMMLPNGRIEELGYVTGGIDTRNICLQVFIDNDAILYLKWCSPQKLRVELYPQTNPKHINLYLTAFLRLYITRHTLFRPNRLDLIA